MGASFPAIFKGSIGVLSVLGRYPAIFSHIPGDPPKRGHFLMKKEKLHSYYKLHSNTMKILHSIELYMGKNFYKISFGIFLLFHAEKCNF